MNEAMGSLRDAASVLFNLPGQHVLEAVDDPDGAREVLIASTARSAGAAPPAAASCWSAPVGEPSLVSLMGDRTSSAGLEPGG